MTTTRKGTPSASAAESTVAPTPVKPARPAAKRIAAPVVPTPTAKAAKHKKAKAEPEKSRQKLIRDSFTIPKTEVATLDALKLRAATLARPAKKSEILRAGIAALHLMSDKALLTALARVPSLKTGRPPVAALADSVKS